MGNVQMSMRSCTSRQCQSTTLVKQYRMMMMSLGRSLVDAVGRAGKKGQSASEVSRENITTVPSVLSMLLIGWQKGHPVYRTVFPYKRGEMSGCCEAVQNDDAVDDHMRHGAPETEPGDVTQTAQKGARQQNHTADEDPGAEIERR